jgi:Thioesterase-like superfamily
VVEAFYEQVGEHVYKSTEHTIGPWSRADQHAGPPAALLTRALERLLPDTGRLVRVTVDLFRGVPVAELEVNAWVVRHGRKVQLAQAELTADGTPVARASGWWHQRTDTGAVATDPEPALPRDGGAPVGPPAWSGDRGYLKAMEWVEVAGGFRVPGPATLWARQRVRLVAGEEPSGLQRVMAVADSGNGVSWFLDLEKWLFINTELTVHAYREPVGEWVCLDAVTFVGEDGVGLATSRLSDERGLVGRGAQALLVRRRR